MSWEDRNYARGEGGFGRPGGDWRGVRPTLDNPFTWSFSIGRYFGIDVRVHIILILFAVIEFVRAIVTDASRHDLYYTSIMLGSLFVLVLLHEFGHCFACRSVGGSADEILMWPLGGLAYCRPPDRWTAHLWTAVGGPLVNVVFAIIFAAILGLTVQVWWGAAIPNPLAPAGAWWDSAAEWQRILYIVALMNLILLAFNVLLPLFPLDGGRMVQSLLWSKFGYVRSMRIALRIGYFGAIIVGIWAIVVQQWMVVAVMVFGGFTCWLTHKQLEYTEEVMGFQYDEYALKLGREVDEEREQRKGPSKRAQKRAARRAEARRRAEQELDRLLEKIKTGGMDSLSAGEKRWLKNQTKQKRDGT